MYNDSNEIEFWFQLSKKILVIDDTAGARQLIKVILTRHNYSVETAFGVYDALARLQTFQPDLIICDLFMPEVNGIDLLKLRRETPELSGIPVIILSAQGDPDLVKEALRLGAFEYLSKPFNQRYLINCIEEALAGNTAHE